MADRGQRQWCGLATPCIQKAAPHNSHPRQPPTETPPPPALTSHLVHRHCQRQLADRLQQPLLCLPGLCLAGAAQPAVLRCRSRQGQAGRCRSRQQRQHLSGTAAATGRRQAVHHCLQLADGRLCGGQPACRCLRLRRMLGLLSSQLDCQLLSLALQVGQVAVGPAVICVASAREVLLQAAPQLLVLCLECLPGAKGRWVGVGMVGLRWVGVGMVDRGEPASRCEHDDPQKQGPLHAHPPYPPTHHTCSCSSA